MVETGSGVCLQEEVERGWEAGLSAEEISREMGVDLGWVDAVLSASHPDGREDGETP